MNQSLTVGQFIIEKEKGKPHAKGSLSRILRDISFAAKVVNREVNKAGLAEILGLEGSVNIQGEEVQKLDVFSDEQFMSAFRHGGKCCAVASEENEDIIILNNSDSAEYIVYIDPLDGSSNIDVNVSVGTIFSIYKRPVGVDLKNEKILFKGLQQVAAGYVIYGSSCMLVYTTGNGVDGFTLDPSIGEFCLSHPQIKMPEKGKIYSINEGNYTKFSKGIKKYIKFCQKKSEKHGTPYTSRYIGSFVADFHRNLIKGGIFIYPSTEESPNGKLRLMYECNPMAFVVEQAGGMALVANKSGERILELSPKEIHQRSPIMIGSKNMIEKTLKILKKYD